MAGTLASFYCGREFTPEDRAECKETAIDYEAEWGEGLEIFTFIDGSKLLVEGTACIQISPDAR